MYNEYKRANLDLQTKYQVQNKVIKIKIKKEYFNTIYMQTLE